MTLLSSFFGLFAVIGIIVEIYKSELHFYKLTGVLCIAILAINNIIYYTEWGIYFLPLIQKISFVVVLAWVGGLTIEMRKRV